MIVMTMMHGCFFGGDCDQDEIPVADDCDDTDAGSTVGNRW